MYTPKETQTAEADIKAAIRSKSQEEVFFDADAALAVTAVFWIEKPKSVPKKRIFPTKKPDVDNLAKLLMDSLNGYLFHDDSQVVNSHFRKRYCLDGQVPRIELEISEEVL
jgi:Holliday junction resolvase RusA-like endonuclease